MLSDKIRASLMHYGNLLAASLIFINFMLCYLIFINKCMEAGQYYKDKLHTMP